MNTAEEDNAQFEAFERRRAREAAAARTTRQRAEEIVANWLRSPHQELRHVVDAIESALLRERAEAVEGERNARQRRVYDWCAVAFGIEHTTSIPQRGIRMLEEAIELAQACECDPAMAHKLIDFVCVRPPGTIRQELGGVGTTVLALANAAGESADQCEAAEVARVLSKPVEHFTKRNEAKNAAGFDTGAYPIRTRPTAEQENTDARGH